MLQSSDMDAQWTKADHDLLVELNVKFEDLYKTAKEIRDSGVIRIDDHEKRLRTLERWGAMITGGLIFLQIMFKYFIK